MRHLECTEAHRVLFVSDSFVNPYRAGIRTPALPVLPQEQFDWWNRLRPASGYIPGACESRCLEATSYARFLQNYEEGFGGMRA